MRITFDKEYLKDLYEKGVADKKHRFQPEIVRKYVKVINIMKNASRVEDLLPFASLNYKVLSGDKSGIESVRVNDKYRIEFVSEHDTVIHTHPSWGSSQGRAFVQGHTAEGFCGAHRHTLHHAQ